MYLKTLKLSEEDLVMGWLYVQNVYLAQAYSNIERQEINNCLSKSLDVEMEIARITRYIAIKRRKPVNFLLHLNF